jgi:CheY-like chemotaxis protein
VRSRGRILIVDDEANARAALSEILREEGYTTETAADGFKALGKLADFNPDVVLTDLKMPGLDGIGLMHKVRELAPAHGRGDDRVRHHPQRRRGGAEGRVELPDEAPRFPGARPVVERAVERARLLAENERLRDRLRERTRSATSWRAPAR